MKTYRVTRKELCIRSLEFDHSNTESRIIPITICGKKMILKKFTEPYTQSYLDNKMYVIQELNKYKERVKNVSKSFILPEMIAVDEDNKKIGYIMSYIAGKNLETVLKDDYIPIKYKINYLKQMCSLLESCEKLRKGGISNFYINDLHVNNFIVTGDKLYLCDMDGCRIDNSKPQSSRYIVSSRGISTSDRKYFSSSNNNGFIANRNTDLYCAIMVIMNFLYDGPVHMMYRKDFDNYINYLRSTKIFDERLLSAFSQIYKNGDNINPKDYLDTITEKSLVKANYMLYKLY